MVGKVCIRLSALARGRGVRRGSLLWGCAWYVAPFCGEMLMVCVLLSLNVQKGRFPVPPGVVAFSRALVLRYVVCNPQITSS